MHNEILKRLKEATFSIVPIVVFVILLNLIIPNFTIESNGSLFGPSLTSLLISSVPLILGTALFSLGAEKSVAKIGEVVGKTMTKRKSIFLLLIIALLMGFLVTIAEPDLSVLATRIGSGSGPNWSLIIVASIGVGIFLMVSILRVMFNKPLKYWLVIGYGLVFTLGLFANRDMFSLVFDAGGVTTGVVTTPFILALSLGVSQVIGGKDAEDAAFGYSGLCTLGTVLSVMVFSIVLSNNGGVDNIIKTLSNKFNINDINSEMLDTMLKPVTEFSQIPALYLSSFLSSLKDVTISMLPILLFFLIFNFYSKIHGKEFASIMIGFLYTFIGLILFFLGAESGFIPVASSLGKTFASKENLLWLFVIVVMALGFISMLAEPSVKILANNVSEVSRGVISNWTIIIALGISTGIALLINTLRTTFDIDFIYFIVPLYIVAIILAFISPNIYVGISIDAAGVATGTMASCFFLPMFISYTATIHGNNLGEFILKDGFGVIGIMAVLPIIVIESLGTFANVKSSIAYRKALARVIEEDNSQVIHLPKTYGSIENV